MKPICIIYTGGTIGMEKNSKGSYSPISRFKSLIQRYIAPAILEKMPAHYLIEISPAIDSSNMNTHNWSQIADLILENYDQCSGFLILHGTDTMAYTASMLSYLFPNINKPIILTGSQIPLCEPCSDAVNNLLISLMMIEKGVSCEVCICFGNQLLRGNRATKISTSAMIAFESTNYPQLATFENQIKCFQPYWKKPSSNKSITLDINTSDLDKYHIAVVYITPSMPSKINSELLDHRTYQGIVLISYGSGNIPNNNLALKQLLQHAQQKNCPIVNISQCAGGEVNQQYEAASQLREYGVISGKDMTIEAAVTKLHYLLSKYKDTPKIICQKMTESLSGELSI